VVPHAGPRLKQHHARFDGAAVAPVAARISPGTNSVAVAVDVEEY
jgi:hypothetical protein